ncbi:MAG: sigma-54 dependent transcriptional regulator [Proteobacteria bacterium]|nr:sigma-54 dependent transcriptional regulator [Pseudomonadota bacterium]
MTNKTYPDFKVLLVDDEESFLRSLAIALERSARITNILRESDSRRVADIIAREDVGLVLLDLTMPHLSGEKLLPMILEEHPDTAVIVVTGINQLETAVECMRLGAYDYCVKTDELSRIISGVSRAVETVELRRVNSDLQKRFLAKGPSDLAPFSSIITRDKTMFSILGYLEAVAKSHQPILVTGESGTGKELVAKTAHTLSRATGEMISFNVAGLDDTMFSDTLFGHVKGAFTGAFDRRLGLIEQAAGGTLFLDEVGDMSPASQIKLLRVLQDKEFYPLGSDRPKQLNARIVAATNRDLEAMRAEGTFRKDLFYRLSTHHVHLPPLRKRLDDIPLLVRHFIGLVARELGKSIPAIPTELYVLLRNYPFPGNIRELGAMIYDAVSVSDSKVLSLATFRRRIGHLVQPGQDPIKREGIPEQLFEELETLPTLEQTALQLMQEAMRRADGNQSIASRLLGISQPALSKRLKRLLS